MLAGRTRRLTDRMVEALNNEEFQWALQLSHYLNWLDDSDKQLVMSSRVRALRGLAAREYNAPNRSYYLSYANEIESGSLE